MNFSKGYYITVAYFIIGALVLDYQVNRHFEINKVKEIGDKIKKLDAIVKDKLKSDK